MNNFRRRLMMSPKKSKDYIKDGLILHLDGIQNTRNGHDENSNVWEDLSGNNFDFTNTTNELGFGENYFYLIKNRGITCSLPMPDFEYVEVVMETPDNTTEQAIFVRRNPAPDKAYNYVITVIKGSIQVQTSTNQSIAFDDDKPHFYSSTLYKDGVKVADSKTSNSYSNTGGNFIGARSTQYPFQGKIYAIRLYDRILTEEETLHNYELDKKRFFEKPDEYIQDGLVVHYDGINNTGNGHDVNTTIWRDLSENNNDGVLVNIDNNSDSGWGENYLHLDGINDYVRIGRLNFQNPTIEVVGSFDSNVDAINGHDLVSNFQSGGYAISTYNTTSKNRNAFTAYISGYKTVQSENDIVIGKVYSLSGSYDGSNMTLWENGIKYKKNQTGAIGDAVNSTNLVVGANPSGSVGEAGYFDGKIYSVRVYDRALTDEEVMHNFEIDKKRFGLESEELKYQQVEYIESTENQCIIGFDYQPMADDKVYIKASRTSGTTEAAIFGRSDEYELYFKDDKFMCWVNMTSPQHNMKIEDNTPYEIEATFTANLVSLNANYIFAYRKGQYTFLGKIWYCYIERDGEKIFNFVPCYRKGDNVIGMYDTVNDVFYTNQGTGIFVKGNDVPNTEII